MKAAVQPKRLVAFFGIACAGALAVGLLADRLPEHVHLLGIFSLLLGVVFGAALAGVFRLLEFGHRPGIVLSAAVAVVVLVVGQHYFAYLRIRAIKEQRAETQRQRLADKDPRLLALIAEDRNQPPRSFAEFLQRQATAGRPLFGAQRATGAAAWWSWTADALLVLAAVLAVVVFRVRKPYCPRCQSWYREIRRGTISAEAAEQLADLCEFNRFRRTAEYRLSACRSGCGPVRLELRARDEEADGGGQTHARWIDGETLGRVEAVLARERARV